MKKLSLILALFFLFAFLPPKTPKLNGTWKVVSGTVISDGIITAYIKTDEKSNQIKTWSDKHFVFVGRFQNSATIQNNYGGGSYILDGTHYTEKIMYHTNAANVGKSIKMILELKGDTLVQTFPADDNWKIDKNNCQIEKSVKLD